MLLHDHNIGSGCQDRVFAAVAEEDKDIVRSHVDETEAKAARASLEVSWVMGGVLVFDLH